ncbi:hypothetical protein [Rhodococcus ruber]|uniref:hypothetical protein n=1 Tax=Rhodococcus ruber TaxID=1830 RepID=UPI00265E7D93|nr:hypothetical protein [Rhodococcus ruber]MDO1481421.1 hypothetical protein [Rhodococcus ruber]
MTTPTPPPAPPARVLVCHTHEHARAYVALHPSLRDHYVVTPRSPERVRGLLIGEYVVAHDDPGLARWARVHLRQGRASLGPLRLARRPAPEHAPADRA